MFDVSICLLFAYCVCCAISVSVLFDCCVRASRLVFAYWFIIVCVMFEYCVRVVRLLCAGCLISGCGSFEY